LIIVAPGVTKPGSRFEDPVDLSVLYPTLAELAQLPIRGRVEGRSLVPMMTGQQSSWADPAVMTYGRGNHAVRSRRWRYIRYVDGTEELYDHDNDPHEWTNLAANLEHAEVKAAHRKWLPKEEVKRVPDLRK
jgi:arylsulfatase A-like enzyme